MITSLTVYEKPRADGRIAIDFMSERPGGWVGGGTWGYLYPVDGYYVLMRYNTIPQGVFTSVADFMTRFQKDTGITPVVR